MTGGVPVTPVLPILMQFLQKSRSAAIAEKNWTEQKDKQNADLSLSGRLC